MAPTQLGGVDASAERPLTDHDTDHDQPGPPPIDPGNVLDILIRNLRPRAGGRRGLANELVDHLSTRIRGGYSKQSLHNKRACKTAMTPDEIRYAAEYLNVPVEVFFLPRPADVLRWISDYRPDDIPWERPLAGVCTHR